MNVPEELAQKLKSAEEKREAANPIKELLCDFLQLAIDDLHSRDPIKRKHARWWIYEDSSTGVDTRTGYLSFQGTCEALDIDPDWLKQVLRHKSDNSDGQGKKTK